MRLEAVTPCIWLPALFCPAMRVECACMVSLCVIAYWMFSRSSQAAVQPRPSDTMRMYSMSWTLFSCCFWCVQTKCEANFSHCNKVKSKMQSWKCFKLNLSDIRDSSRIRNGWQFWWKTMFILENDQQKDRGIRKVGETVWLCRPIGFLIPAFS